MHSSLPSFVAYQPNGSLLLSLLDFVVFVVVRSLSNFVVPVVNLGWLLWLQHGKLKHVGLIFLKIHVFQAANQVIDHVAASKKVLRDAEWERVAADCHLLSKETLFCWRCIA